MPSSSLLPDDPSVLLTTAGMQQFKKYYTGELDAMNNFGSKNTVSIQKSFRTSDIDEVGDESHNTFFEMLGNFSFGGYWKEEAITYAYQFITKVMNLPISYVSVFRGSDTVPRDEESERIWRGLGVTDVRGEGMEDVFWGPTGSSGPCGPTTEIYCKNVADKDIEIWNIVFNEFFCDGSREALLSGNATLTPLATKGIDTGMGLERLAMVSQGVSTIFDTDLFTSLTKDERRNILLPARLTERVKGILLDHVRASTFLIADGVRPSNKEAGYILRRLLRRAIVHTYLKDKVQFTLDMIFRQVCEMYSGTYPELQIEHIVPVFHEEDSKFLKTVRGGLKELSRSDKVDAKIAFKLYESYGLPYEVIKDYAEEKAKNLNREAFDEEFRHHQKISRAGQEKKFGGHGLILNTGELKAANEEELKKVTRLHTATHMLQRALCEVLGPEVKQAGSDITVERTRFDFTFPRKLTDEEKKSVEFLVNQKIREDVPVQKVELPKADAEKTGALYFFKEKYPDPVNVYFIGDNVESAWSKEFCGGPHVTHTGEIGEFEIVKEEAVGSGTRRIRAIVKS